MRDLFHQAIEKIDSLSKEKELHVVSHFDTDGITSAAVFSRALQRWGKAFTLDIVKGLEEDFIRALPDHKVLIFLDLASGSLKYLGEKNTEVFIFDHHELTDEIPKNVMMINPQLYPDHEPLSGAAICYLFAKALSARNQDLATLAVLGMIGDSQEKNIGHIFNEILQDSETVLRKGLLFYPSTRPLDKTLEYCSQPFIPGVSGSYKGAVNLLRDAGIPQENGRYKALYELSEEEMSHLTTSIVLKTGHHFDPTQYIGNLFLVKFFNTVEDARELSALINACSRMDSPEVCLGFCLGNRKFREIAQGIYIEYKQSLMHALRYVEDGAEKITGNSYTIIHGRDKIKDTIIGTVASIMSYSPMFEAGTVIVALAYNQDKVKVSARLSGTNGRNVRDVLHQVVVPLGGEVGGHPKAAGCLISRDQEPAFLEHLKRVLDVELVKV